MSGPRLRVEGLTVRYGALTAVEDVSWQVDAGEILGIIGPNGAGKSSGFAAVAGSVRHEGRVHLDGRGVSGLGTPRLARLGLRRTFQQNSFFAELSVLDNAMAALAAQEGGGLGSTLSPPWRTARERRLRAGRAAELLDRFGIGRAHHRRRPDELPYGLQRTLSVALACTPGARVVLLDEPAAGVGGDDMRHLADLLAGLREEGIACVVIEHHMDLIMEVADRIAVLDAGRLLVTGTPAEVQRDERVLEAYLGRTA